VNKERDSSVLVKPFNNLGQSWQTSSTNKCVKNLETTHPSSCFNMLIDPSLDNDDHALDVKLSKRKHLKAKEQYFLNTY